MADVDKQTLTVELPESVTKALADVEALKAQIGERKAAEPAGLPTDLEAARKENAEIEKQLNEIKGVLQKALEEQKRELQESKAEVEKLHKQQRREKFIRRSRELQHLPGTQADDFAETLDLIQAGLTKIAPDRAETVFRKFNELLTSWDTVVEQHDLIFKEIGREGGDLGMLSGVEAQIEALAQEKRRAEPKLTIEKARTLVIQERPDLYAKYKADHPSGRK